MVELVRTYAMPRRCVNTPGLVIERLFPMPSNPNTPMPSESNSRPWDPDPYGQTAFDLWEAYKTGIDAFHTEWVRDDPTRKSGYVYVIAMISQQGHMRDGHVVMKIGMSRNPQKRFKEIRKSNVKMPYTMRLWHTYWSSDMVRAERLLHMMLQQYRLDGEWFSLPQPIWEAFDSLWYIVPYHSTTELEFRNSYTGAWYTPQAFFEYQLEWFRTYILRNPDSEDSGGS